MVGIIGLAFTNNTPVITDSPAIKLIKKLLDHNIHITVFDKLAIRETKKLFGTKLEYANSEEECLKKSNVVVITLRSFEYKQVIENFSPDSHLTIIDCWRILDENKVKDNISYIPLGRFNKEA